MNNFKYQPSFGRRLGRPLRIRSQKLLVEGLPKLVVNETEVMQAKTIHLEIGFGNGDHLLARAITNPDILFIGCEPYINGVSSLLAKIEDNKVTNIRIYPDDVRKLLESTHSHCLDHIYVLYPDPWPKKRQQKRRLLNSGMFSLLHQKLKPSGQITIATDHQDYADYIFEQLQLCPFLNAHYTHTPPTGWITTKYEQKAKSEKISIYHYFLITATQ
jgi:tRNA (guanine-N(7)-)-methyltransferase